MTLYCFSSANPAQLLSYPSANPQSKDGSKSILHQKYLSSRDSMASIDREHPRDEVVSSPHGADIVLGVVRVVDLSVQFLIC